MQQVCVLWLSFFGDFRSFPLCPSPLSLSMSLSLSIHLSLPLFHRPKVTHSGGSSVVVRRTAARFGHALRCCSLLFVSLVRSSSWRILVGNDEHQIRDGHGRRRQTAPPPPHARAHRPIALRLYFLINAFFTLLGGHPDSSLPLLVFGRARRFPFRPRILS